jgi:hypothetical protein
MQSVVLSFEFLPVEKTISAVTEQTILVSVKWAAVQPLSCNVGEEVERDCCPESQTEETPSAAISAHVTNCMEPSPPLETASCMFVSGETFLQSLADTCMGISCSSAIKLPSELS